jgi:orotate phosphoribosyltransferase
VDEHKRAFIEFLVEAQVLTFGDFVTKSGRRTPYFINTGRFSSGGQLGRLGAAYAHTLHERLGAGFDLLFGPAYKGIPLATATAIALAHDFGHDVQIGFNRKEVKDHGEGGSLVGHVPKDGERIVIIEDVTTAGTSIREVVPALRAAAPNCQLVALVVAVDRQERGPGGKLALVEVAETYGLQTFPIVTIDEVVAHLSAHAVNGRMVLDQELLGRIRAYRAEFGG